MSYQISLEVRNGTVTVVSADAVPDGQYVISGHADTDRDEVSVSATGVDGKPYIFASSRHMKRR